MIPGASEGFDSIWGEILEVRLPTDYQLTLQEPHEIKSRYTAAFTKFLDEHIEKIREVTEERGVMTVRSGGAEHHVRWLVLNQVCDTPISRIATDEEKDPKTVREAITNLRAYLRLPDPPERKPGRPAGSKTRHSIHT